MLQLLSQDECRQLGMGCYLGVAEASDEPAKFIHLTYKPTKAEGNTSNKVKSEWVTRLQSDGFHWDTIRQIRC